MKIWIVKHHQDNGEHYEDQLDWDNWYYFSTWEKAYSFYCNHIMDEYKGQYSLIEQTLDTQEQIVLETSPWGGYSVQEYDYDVDDCNDYYEPSYFDAAFSREEEYNLAEIESLEEEFEAERDWLVHEGENYKIFKEIENDRLLKLINDLDSLLNQ